MPDTETLAELFARDPFSYTKQDIDRVIESNREARKNFNLGKKPAAAAKPKVSLEDLGL